MTKAKTALSILAASFLIVALMGAGCVQKKSEEETKEESKTKETTDEQVTKDTTNAATETDSTEPTGTADKTEDKTETTETKKTEWKLVSGDPSDTCTAPTYEGEVEVSGWYVYDYSYVEKAWLLQIIDADVDKIPVKEVYGEESYNQWVEKPQFLFNATSEQEVELKAASKDSPVKVIVKAFRAYCEGAPQLSQSSPAGF